MGTFDVNIFEYIHALKRRKWIAISFFLLVVVTVTLATLRQPKIYRSTTTLEVGAEIPDVAFFKEVVSVNPTNWWTIGRYYETQYKIIKSRQILEQVSRRLVEQGVLRIDGNKKPESYFGFLRGRVSVEPVGQSRLVNISFDDTDPERAAKICNGIAEVYIEENLNRKLVGAKQAVDWLSHQLQTFQSEKEKSDDKLREFKNKYKIVSVENPIESTTKNLDSLSETLNNLRNKRIELEARYKQLRAMVTSKKDVEDLFGVVDSDLLAKLKADYVDQERATDALAHQYGRKHPKMVRARKDLDQLKRKINMEVNSEVQRLKTVYLLAKSEEDAVAKALEDSKLEALEFEQVNYELKHIKRVADTNQKFYIALSEKLKEADLSGLVKSNNIRVIDAALPSYGPIRPKVLLNISLALMIGLIGGIGAALLTEHLDSTFKTQEEVERLLKLPFLGLVPLLSLDDEAEDALAEKTDGNGSPSEPQTIEHVPVTNPSSTVAEFYRQIRTNLTFVTSNSELKTLLVTSAGAREGKSATSLNLAITLAQLNQKVLLVDCDLRRPSVHHFFGLKNRSGFSNLLIGAMELEDVIVETDVANLTVLPSGPLPPNPAELLSMDRAKFILEDLKKRYDKIIIDTCPTLPISDAVIMSQIVDGAIMVILSEGPQKNHVIKSKQQLEKVEANLIGTILNGVAPDQLALTSRYHYYRYGYYSRNESEETIDPDSTPQLPG